MLFGLLSSCICVTRPLTARLSRLPARCVLIQWSALVCGSAVAAAYLPSAFAFRVA